MRLDKFLAELNIGTRSRVKELIRKGQVSVNGQPVKTPDAKIDEERDIVSCQGRTLQYRRYVYYMMNKPEGVVCATRDNVEKTVLDLLMPYLKDEDAKKEIFPAGRLDKDTTGLLLLTNDGMLTHALLSPAKHVPKTYLACLRDPLTDNMKTALARGVDIGEAHITKPAQVEPCGEDPCRIRLSIHEGKYHQVKRMLQAVGNEVVSLKRVAFGGLALDEALKSGECRELTENEIVLLARGAEKGAGIPEMDGVEAVIFDLDGTLVDSMWIWRDIDIEYLGKFGIPLPEDLQNRIEGMSFQETAVYFKETFQIPDSLDRIKADWNAMAWDKYEREVPLKPGVFSFLVKCRERGIKLGIATSNSRELVENIANTHGLHDYFTAIQTGSDVKRGKPAPDIYLAVAAQLGVKPENCLVFEDIIPGIQAARNAGMRVCAVEDAYSADVRDAKKALADYYIEDYTVISV